MLKQHDYIPENEGSVWTENSGVSLLRKKGVYLDRRSGVSYAGISSSPVGYGKSNDWKLVWLEDDLSEIDARKREEEIKDWKSRKRIEQLIGSKPTSKDE